MLCADQELPRSVDHEHRMALRVRSPPLKPARSALKLASNFASNLGLAARPSEARPRPRASVCLAVPRGILYTLYFMPPSAWPCLASTLSVLRQSSRRWHTLYYIL